LKIAPPDKEITDTIKSVLKDQPPKSSVVFESLLPIFPLLQGEIVAIAPEITAEFKNAADTRRPIFLPLFLSHGEYLKEAAPTLKEYFGRQSLTAHLQYQVCGALCKMGAADKEHLVTLVKVTQSLGGMERSICDILRNLGPEATKTIHKQLFETWKQDTVFSRKIVLSELLIDLDPSSHKDTATWLKGVLDSTDSSLGQMMCSTVRVLHKVEPKNPRVVATLRKYLADPSPANFQHAASIAGELREAAKELLPDLTDGLKRPLAEDQTRAWIAIARIDKSQTEKAIDTFIDRLTNPATQASRYSAITGLGEIGGPFPKALQALKDFRLRAEPALHQHIDLTIRKLTEVK
jgi:hypothetical protein